MNINNVNIAISDSCAVMTDRFANAEIINLKDGKAIAEYFKNVNKTHTLLILSTETAYSDSLPDISDASMAYHSIASFVSGSVRDDFDFGNAIIINNSMARKAVELMDSDIKLAGFYDFRLMLSTIGAIERSPSPILPAMERNDNDFEAAHFAYCDPRNRAYQIEAEKVFTKYLKITNRYIKPVTTPVEGFDEIMGRFQTTASVIIPVKDRPEVIADAIDSAMGQVTNFPFNVIVVDNQSQQPTRDILYRCQEKYANLHVIETTEPGIGIGGCWNIGIQSEHCGAIAAQLDSDDVYSSTNTLQQIVDTFRREKCGVLIGSYRLTDINLKPLNDIIIDHREYTQENGVNNALRVNGFGAPRCYLTELVRKNEFRNVSYGEDYDLCLRLSRQYKLSRIFDVLYFCRRWGKNSDSNMTPEKLAKFNLMKDTFRSEELERRTTPATGQAQ